MSDRKSAWWFILGREPLLSTAEIISILRGHTARDFNYSQKILKYSGDLDPAGLMTKLGGTIKIAAELGADLNEEQLFDTIKADLSTQAGKIVFGISLYGEDSLQKIENWGKSLKKSLKSEGRSVRYVFNKEMTLSSVTVEKNGLAGSGAEFIIQKINGLYSLAKTSAVQPFEEFSKRDYGRPGRDSFSGMLPPKLAMMLINLAAPQNSEVLLDPFCGSGTILTEAALLKVKKMIGTDASEKAITDSTQNLEWTRKELEKDEIELTLKTADVTTISNSLAPRSVDVVVTEPFMGPPLKGSETRSQLEKTALELEDLYRKAFSEFKKILRPGGRIIFIIPRFSLRDASIKISDRLVPQLRDMGFRTSPVLPETINKQPFLLYSRPGQAVSREVWRFQA